MKKEWAVVTGSARGIGRAIVERFQAAGWGTIGIDVEASFHRAHDHFFRCSAADPKAMKEAASEIGRKKIKLACLINNAAIQIPRSLLDTTQAEWARLLESNLTSVFVATKQVAPLLDGGSIVNVSSVHARATVSGMAAYVASKGGVSALTRALALELAGRGIRVNAVLPGAIDTDMLKEGNRRSPDPKSALANLVARTPLKRIGLPEDVAELALFLADSKRSGFITGQEFACDGGALARLGSE